MRTSAGLAALILGTCYILLAAQTSSVSGGQPCSSGYQLYHGYCVSGSIPSIENPYVAPFVTTIDTPYGQFLFTGNINVAQPDSSWPTAELVGEIRNNTSKDWVKPKFALVFYDRNNSLIKFSSGREEGILQETIDVGSLDKGQLVPVKASVMLTFPAPRIAAVVARLSSGAIEAKYTFVLLRKSVSEEQRPPNVATRSNKLATKPAPAEFGTTDLHFADRNIDIAFAISKSEVGFVLKNLSQEPLELNWNQVAYVDVGGKSHRVMHTGVKYIERDQPFAPTIIPPSAKIDDIVLPTDYVFFGGGDWSRMAFFPDGERAAAYKGLTFALFMPVKANGFVKNYMFKFKVADVE
jgi:hypothetical protein